MQKIADRLGGMIVLLMGLSVAAAAQHYDTGSLASMGPGFMPVVLGVLLAIVGLAMLVVAPVARKPDARPAGLSMRGMLCILAGVASFAVLGNYLGLVPASFCAVFIASLGDRDNSLRDALILALAATIVGVVVFAYGLHLQLPLFYGG